MGKVEINIPESELKRMNYHLGSLSGWVSRCGYKELGLEDLEVTVELFEADFFRVWYKIKINGKWVNCPYFIISKFDSVLSGLKISISNFILELKQTNGKRS